jgi:hypothetical protein
MWPSIARATVCARCGCSKDWQKERLMSRGSFRTDPERLEKLIEAATVDCYDEEEQHSGLLTMIEDEVVFPFDAKVMGEIVQITGCSYWIPGSWNVRLSYTDDISSSNP